MLPQHFVALEALPKTPNNKIDRKALPPVNASVGIQAYRFEEPQAGVEKELAAFWIELLQAPRVSRNDNFFDLGGHSLLSMQVMAWAKRHYGVSIYPLTLITDTLSQISIDISEKSNATFGEVVATAENGANGTKPSFVKRILKSFGNDTSRTTQ
jgi:hypothetical protein